MRMAEHWRVDTFKLWCWRRLLRVSWTARNSNPSILKEINPEYSLERLCVAETPIPSAPNMKSLSESRTGVWAALGDGGGQGSLACCGPWGPKGSDTTERLSNSPLWETVEAWGAWHAAAHEAAKSGTWLSDRTTNWRGPSRLHYCFLAAPPLSLHPLPSLISSCLNLPMGTWNITEAEWSLFPVIKKLGNKGKVLFSEAPQYPSRF